jgi:hypothetical protein
MSSNIHEKAKALDSNQRWIEHMGSRLNFAPVSNAQSSLLRFASGYFLLNGVVSGLLLVILLLGSALGRVVFAPTATSVLSIVIQAVSAVGLVWTGSLLGRGARVGGFLALGFILLPIGFAALSSQPIVTINVVFAVLGVIVFAIIWRELK